MFLFCLECIGTARILATVHPWASNLKSKTDRERNQHISDTIYIDTEATNRQPDWLLCRYIKATLQSRLKSSANAVSKCLLTIPPASCHLLEKLGLVTAIALIDDELACEPHSTPQQLLIPSKDGGLKILDLCPAFNEEDELSSEEEDNEIQLNNNSSRSSTQLRKSNDGISLDSDDDDENEETRFAHSFSAPARSLKRKLRKRYSRKRSSSRVFWSGVNRSNSQQAYHDLNNYDTDVQFEDPDWWQFLPSLKCIGLSCMLIESTDTISKKTAAALDKMIASPNPNQKVVFRTESTASCRLTPEVEKLLFNHLCIDRERKQLRMLARCIGFSDSPSELGNRGDLSSFILRRRLHIISSDLLHKRMQLKYHAMGLEEYRNWSRLYTDADSVFVKDTRSGGDLVLTVGDARVVTELCPDNWQGESETFLSHHDRI